MSASRAFAARALAKTLRIGLAVVLAYAITELALRTFPAQLLPPGTYGAGRYSPELRMNVHGSRLYYNRLRFVTRMPNRDGFADVEHEPLKPSGTLRVAFFGDSYVEGMQLPLDQLFFRRLTPRIGERSLEPFSFGLSGWGTIHGLAAWRALAPRYAFDAVAYFFVENDLGDNDSILQGPLGRVGPGGFTAAVSDEPPGFRIDAPPPASEVSIPVRILKLVQQRSVLMQTAINRWFTFRQARAPATMVAGRPLLPVARTGGIPDPNDPPSTWPPEHLARVQELGRRILAAWIPEVAASGAHFFVVYVPNGEPQLRGEIPLSDTFRPWLGDTCDAFGIPLLDPTRALAARLAAGEAMYDDHWTPAAEGVIAGLVNEHLEALYSSGDDTGQAPGR